MPELRTIPIAEIDEPPLPMRASMDDGKLKELAESIADAGLQQPITVVERKHKCTCSELVECDPLSECPTYAGSRYEIVTGHRRFIAHQMLNRHEVLCIVRQPGEVEIAAAMIAENCCREDVNAAEEAIWMAQLVEQHGFTEEQLMKATRRSADYIGDRFRLLRGDPEVFKAVQAGHITHSTARELNKCKNEEMRRYFTDAAVRGGTPSRIVRRWIDDYVLQSTVPQNPNPVILEVPAPEAVDPHVPECALCGGRKDPWNLVNVTLHRWELDLILKAQKEAASA